MGMENMSVENVKKFREELQTNKELKKKLEDLNLGTRILRSWFLLLIKQALTSPSRNSKL